MGDIKDFEIVDGVLIKYHGKESEVVVPEGVTVIGDKAFFECEYLDSISIPDSVEYIGDKAFSYCRYLTSITCFKTLNPNKNYKSIDGNLYTKDGKTLVSYAVGKLKHEFVVPNSVKNIGAFAFHGCEELYEISMPRGVKTIGEGAFAECVNLNTIVLPNSVSNIGEGAFFYCMSIVDFKLDEGNKNYQLIDGNLYTKDGKILVACLAGYDDTELIRK